ncbi:homoserine kinase [Ruaniaceae bacterium KH17]|nr:homoserine kinase [Ruaniaceae bacterium KH17]
MRFLTDHASVTVPATTANLGPGFDSIGMALELRDRIIVRATAGETRVTVRGEGQQTAGLGEDHLVVRAIRVALEYVGAPQIGIDLTCHNSIPHSRGLGSSASAVAAGIAAVRAMISEPESLDDDAIFRLVTDFEGHPDNAAPAVYGGAQLTWMDEEGPHTIPLPVHESIQPYVMIPPTESLTATTRAVLPRTIAHSDAVFNLQRSALLVEALRTGEHLLPATDDRLHQPYRREVMPQTAELIDSLRRSGIPAALSGAGPTVFSFISVPEQLATALSQHGWTVRALPVATEGVRALAQ